MSASADEQVTIRAATPADAAGIARVNVDAWRTTYPGIVPADFLAQLSYERQARNWERIQREHADRVIVLVAETGSGEIVGFASAELDSETERPATADLKTIYLVQAWQQHGIGSRLVHEIVRQLRAAGQHSLVVWVAAESQAGRRFYEALGGQLAESSQMTFGELTMDVVAYRWSDIAALERAVAARGR